MARSPATAFPGSDFRQALLEAYAVNDRMNQLVLEHLDPRAWHAKPFSGGVRTIAALFTHMHNIRRKWLRLSAPDIKLPPQLDRGHCTQQQARKALAESAARCTEMLAEALSGEHDRIKQFRRDAWAKPWPVGAAMFTYMVQHDAHHRGQACMLAHQLGFRLPTNVNYTLWSWETLYKQSGFAEPH